MLTAAQKENLLEVKKQLLRQLETEKNTVLNQLEDTHVAALGLSAELRNMDFQINVIKEQINKLAEEE